MDILQQLTIKFPVKLQLTPRVPIVSVRLSLVLLHTCLLIQHMRYQKDLGLGMMLNGGGRVAPSSK